MQKPYQQLDAPIFVVGNVHSGTTLLRKILANHPQIFSGYGETQFYPHLAVIRSRFPDLRSGACYQLYIAYLFRLITRNFNEAEKAFEQNLLDVTMKDIAEAGELRALLSEARNIDDHERLYFKVFDAVAFHAGARRWLEKTPAHLFYVDEILRENPAARIVEIVRDPRAVLASKRARAGDEWLDRQQNNRATKKAGGYDPVLHSLAWKSAYRQGVRARRRFPNDILSIRYEDLVEAPDTVVKTVCNFVDLPFKQEMLEVHVTNSTSRQRPDGVGIGKEAVDRWKAELPESDILICDWVNKSEINAIGYEPYRTRRKRTYIALPVVVSRSAIEVCRIAWRRWRLKGSSYLIDLGRNYIKRLKNVSGLAK